MITYDLYKETLCFVDYETSNLCLNETNNQPWQAAYILVKGKKIIARDSHFINWGDRRIPVSKEAAIITRYDERQVIKEGISPKEAFEKMVSNFNQADRIIGHNILGFDVYIANILALGNKKAIPFGTNIHKVIDTLALAKASAAGEQYEESVPLIAWMYQQYHTRRKGRFSQEALSKSMSIEYDSARAHDALFDLEYLNIPIFNQLIYKTKI